MDTTPASLVDHFLGELDGQRAVRTIASYRTGYDRILEFLGDDTTLDVDRLAKFPAWLAKRGYQKKSRQLYATCAIILVRWAIRNEIIRPRQAAMARLEDAIASIRRQRESKLPKDPSQETLNRIRLGSAQAYKSPILERNIALIEFMYSTGCRIGEVVRLKVRDIDLELARAKVTGKGEKERYVYFSRKAKELILLSFKARGFSDDDDPVFSSHKNPAKHTHLSTQAVWQIIRKAMQMGGVRKSDFTPHYFRHAFATRMLRETGNLAVVQDLLGHASAESTRLYAKTNTEELGKAHSKVYNKE